MAEFAARSPLDGQAPALLDDDHGPSMGEVALRGYVNLRGKPRARRFVSAVESVLGCKLPRQANTLEAGDRCAGLWLAPDEWLLVTEPDVAPALVADLEAALQGIRHAVNDLSGGYTTVRLQGLHVRQILAKGCTLDLDASVFSPPSVAQTLVAKAGVILVPLPASRGFDLIVRRSFADYLWAWLRDAGGEYEVEPLR